MNVYTVTMPGGAKDMEYEAYVRLLNKWNVDLTNLPRVLEKGTPNRWLYAWKQKEDAERFASELRTQSKNSQWKVHSFPTDKIETGPLGPVEINFSRQRDGYTYALHPNSRELVMKKFPDARTIASVFIGRDTQSNFQQSRQESIWDHVAMILTGLSEGQLDALGGYRIYDPVKSEILREPESRTAPMAEAR